MRWPKPGGCKGTDDEAKTRLRTRTDVDVALVGEVVEREGGVLRWEMRGPSVSEE